MKKNKVFFGKFLFYFFIFILGKTSSNLYAVVKCKDMAEGNNFPIVSDGRALAPCQRAYQSCLYVSLLKRKIAQMKLSEPISTADQKNISNLEKELARAVSRKKEDLTECGLFMDFFSVNGTAAQELEMEVRTDDDF